MRSGVLWLAVRADWVYRRPIRFPVSFPPRLSYRPLPLPAREETQGTWCRLISWILSRGLASPGLPGSGSGERVEGSLFAEDMASRTRRSPEIIERPILTFSAFKQLPPALTVQPLDLRPIQRNPFPFLIILRSVLLATS